MLIYYGMADTKYHHLRGGSADILPSAWRESMSRYFTAGNNYVRVI